MYWFTSDCHFGHKNVLRLCNRPFNSIQHMEEEIIKKWNKKVNPNDVVYMLGDITWGYDSKEVKNILDKMNGIKYLIIGNHDKIGPHQLSNCWAEIVPYKRIIIDNKIIILSHYPMLEWDGAYHKSIHLHGHTHGLLDLKEYTKLTKHGNINCMDVGMDTNNYEPYSWEDIKKIMNIL